jgi:hypothetical protein
MGGWSIVGQLLERQLKSFHKLVRKTCYNVEDNGVFHTNVRSSVTLRLYTAAAIKAAYKQKEKE